MNLVNFVFNLVAALMMVGVVNAADATITATTATTKASSSSTVSPTSVWVTVTLAGGAITVVQTRYSQVFDTLYSPVPSPSSGVIGIGSLSTAGTVGGIRSYDQTTINNAGVVTPGVVGGFAAVVMMLL